MEKMKKN